MMIIRIEVPINVLAKQVYNFNVIIDYNDKVELKLITYQELSRESPRKRIWNVDRWYDWYNHRDRYKSNFIDSHNVEIPEYVKQSVIKEFMSRIIITKGT